MNKIAQNQMQEDAQRRQINMWRQKHGITPQAYAELLRILYGNKPLTKGDQL